MTDRELPPPTQPAMYGCNKCGYYGEVGESHCIGHTDELCPYLAAKSGPYWDEAGVRRAIEQNRGRREAEAAALRKLLVEVQTSCRSAMMDRHAPYIVSVLHRKIAEGFAALAAKEEKG